MTARLVTIPFSHYCEKARWALDRCGVSYVEEGHLPILHRGPVRRAGGGRTVPLLVDGDLVLTDSTDIVAFADAKKPGSLLPIDPDARSAVLALEDELDRGLGPAARRWAYQQLLPRAAVLARFLRHGVPRWESRLFLAARPLAALIIRRTLRITPDGVDRSLVKVDAAFATIAALLADGRPFLGGERFSVADITFASLAAPVLLPSDFPVPLPAPTDLGSAASDRIAAWRASPAGAYALRLYATERRVAP